jgi:hypothetical protein
MFLSSASGRAYRLASIFVVSTFVFTPVLSGLEVHAAEASMPVPAVSQSSVQSMAPLSLEKSLETGSPSGALIAHHESSGLGASQLLTTGISSPGSGGLTTSLWANLIVSMAYQQDAKLQAVVKKLHRLGIFTFSSIAAISALTVAQSIDGIVTLQDDPHPKSPPIMGLIGSGMTLATIGTQAIVGHRYKKQLMKRQHEIQDEILHIMAHLKSDGVSDGIKSDLSHLIGSEATDEFIEIWASVHH